MIKFPINNKEEYQVSKDYLNKVNRWRSFIKNAINVSFLFLVAMIPVSYLFGLEYFTYSSVIFFAVIIILAGADSDLSTSVLNLQMEQISFLISELPEVKQDEY